MSTHHKVTKAGPTLDAGKAGGISFTPSEATQQAINAIAEQMQSPDADHVGPVDVDESTILDDAFTNMTSPPSVKIANKAFRKKLEETLKPVDVSTLFLKGEITQEVPILRGFTVEFRTLSSAEDLFIKQRLTEVKAEVVRYVEDRFMIMQLAAHLYSINGEKLPTCLIDGKVAQDKFDERFERVINLPVNVVERLWVHWVWFQTRVNDMLDDDFLTVG
jgi:hypothetical protein